MQNEYTQKVLDLVDWIKAVCTHWWLWWEASEYKIVTQSFLYKFLNDKFLHELKKLHPERDEDNYESISKDEWTEMLEYEMGNKAAHFQPQYLLTTLFKRQDNSDFAITFDDTLHAIAVENNEIFSVHTEWNTDIRLFDDRLIQSSFSDANKWNTVAKQIINKLAQTKFNFDEIFDAWFDFFSTIFEYMIKDYNKDWWWKYAEYYTPHSVAKIIAEILVGDDDVKNVTVYDPAAGSGTLLMNLASKIWTDNCTIYSQDISQKSSNLLRLNLILNNLTHSINNIVQWNTILNDRHASQKMDYVVSNPPFKLDFSDWRDEADALPKERFFAGVPTIPNKKLESMAIYLLFIQHILYSLSDTGKAAIVVPTGFITAQSGIEKKIRERIVDKNWLKWVVSMPSNIFATTWTNVSVIFIDKTRKDGDEIMLIDASKLWETVKEWKNQKTYLRDNEQQQIIDTFKNMEVIEDFSVKVTNDQIKEKNYSWSAGQYFEIKIEHIDITAEEFETRMNSYKQNLKGYFEEWKKLQDDIFNQLSGLKYE